MEDKIFFPLDSSQTHYTQNVTKDITDHGHTDHGHPNPFTVQVCTDTMHTLQITIAIKLNCTCLHTLRATQSTKQYIKTSTAGLSFKLLYPCKDQLIIYFTDSFDNILEHK